MAKANDQPAREIEECKRAEEALHESRAWIDLALHSAHMGTWYWDLSEGMRYFDGEACHSLGIEPTRSPLDVEEFLEVVHPADI